MLPEWSEVGSRRPLESSLGPGPLPSPISTAKLRPFRTQNWSQNRPGSLPKSIWKATSKQTRFRDRFGTDFWSIFEPLEANFWSKLKAFTCKVNVTLDKTEFFRNYVKTQYFWKKIGYHRWLKHIRTRWKLNVEKAIFAFALACRCEVPFGTDFGTQNGIKIGPKELQNRSRNGFERR